MVGEGGACMNEYEKNENVYYYLTFTLQVPAEEHEDKLWFSCFYYTRDIIEI